MSKIIGKAKINIEADNKGLETALARSADKLKKFSAEVQQIGAKIAGLGAAMSTPFIVGLKTFSSLEKQLAMVSTMMGKIPVSMFSQQLRDMAVSSGQGTATLSKGLYDILSASIPAAEAMDVLAVSVKAAKAGMTDTGVAADAITTMLNAYGLSSRHAGDISDLLFQIVKRGKTTFEELAPSIGKVASTAAASGLSLDDLGAALATMTRNGVRTELAVNAVQAIVSSFIKPTKGASDAAKKFGIELNSTTLQTEGLLSVFQKIAQLPADQIAKVFPNIRSLRGVIPALKNMAGFTEDLQLMRTRAGAADDAAGKMGNTLIGIFNKLKESGIEISTIFGEAIEGPVKRFAKVLLEASKNVIGFLRENKNLIRVFGALALGITAVGGALVTLGTVGLIAAASMKGIATSIGLINTAITVATPAINIFSAALGKLGAIGPVVSAALSSMGAFLAKGALVVGGTVAAALAAGIAGYFAGQWLGKVTGITKFISDGLTKMFGPAEMTGADAEKALSIKNPYKQMEKDFEKTRAELVAIKKQLDEAGIKGGLYDTLEKIKKQYGDISEISIQKYIQANEKAAQAAKAAAEEQKKALDGIKKKFDELMSIDWSAGFEQSFKDFVSQAGKSDQLTELEKLDDKYTDLIASAKLYAEKNKLSADQLKEIIAQLDIAKQKETDRIEAMNADKKRKDEKAALDQVLDEIYLLNADQVRQNGTLEERLRLIDQETVKRQMQAKTKEEFDALAQLGLQKKLVETDRSRADAMRDYEQELEQAEAQQIKNTATLEDDLDLLEKQRQAAIKKAEAQGANLGDIDLINKVFALRKQDLTKLNNNGPASIGGFSARGVALQMGWQDVLVKDTSRTARATEKIAYMMAHKNTLAFN